MASRIRTIKPEFFQHERLFDAERVEGLPLRVAFAGLWTVADREGRFRWRPRQLKLNVLPYDEVDFAAVLNALLKGGFIVHYESAGEEYGAIPRWAKHQVINNRESDSELPTPPETDACLTRASRVLDASPTPLVHAQGEGNGREEEGNGREEEGTPAAHVGERQARRRAASPNPKPDRPEGVCESVWADWVELRRVKKAPITRTVLEGAISEAKKAGMPLEEFLRVWCRRGSQGLDADWLKPNERPTQTSTARSALHADNMIGEPQ